MSPFPRLDPPDKYLLEHFASCTLCPRRCHVNRLAGEPGYCGQTARLRAARAALHMWEEPCISGSTGSGTVFFSGCSLGCIYCQNQDIALGQAGREITPQRLTEIFLELQQKGAANINLVTPTHFVPLIVHALEQARDHGLSLPVVYNCGGYESVDALKMLDGLVDIYLPDFKYASGELSARFSHVADYLEKAKLALAEMYRQVGRPVFAAPSDSLSIRPSLGPAAPPSTQPTPQPSTRPSDRLSTQPPGRPSHRLSAQTPDRPFDRLSDADTASVYPSDTPLLRRGMIVRHLVLPGQVGDSKKILHYLRDTYGNNIYVSVMRQYTPLPQVAHIPGLNRRVTEAEYQRVVDFCLRLGMENVYIQEGDTARESFIPPFNFTGL
ncbi:MAG: radical SAM protein [Lachnospiraceae bacterium]|nr:radical SAM protein [Lachnospiraceae bacterium]